MKVDHFNRMSLSFTLPMQKLVKHKQERRCPLSYLIKEYSRSADFTSKSDKIKHAYIRFLTEIEDIFGDLTLKYIQSPRARGKFK
ncbi:hypothetical protein [Pseudochrobactrum sp. B5]|uniref:hypothetical protein n=1 Tax=Pseudochrobactrum sp. B5 TaxID=1289478 RepID=UPI001FD9CD6D|nr:hypothetical protein [Pseudochrobactrum sp. B5]